ncbi:MAG TPA: hypothetical protein VJ922_09185 [Actinomycetota bacterium]|nr:hypothetical protein [Actinomycetota bacterium]
MSRKAIVRSGVVIVLTFCSLTLMGSAAKAQQIDDNEGSLTVTPRRGPIGTTVTLRGNGCSVLAFIGGDLGGGTTGADPLPEIDLDPDGDFEVTYRIPSRLEPTMGQGGARPNPGTYFFRSFPPRCYAEFEVTGLATTGPAKAQLAAIAVLGGLLLVAGTVMRVSVRSGPSGPRLAP